MHFGTFAGGARQERRRHDGHDNLGVVVVHTSDILRQRVSNQPARAFRVLGVRGRHERDEAWEQVAGDGLVRRRWRGLQQ